jgi:hypothetical protein
MGRKYLLVRTDKWDDLCTRVVTFDHFLPTKGFLSYFILSDWEVHTLLKKIDAFSTESIDFSGAFFSALKVKCFQPNFAIFFTLFFTNIENATKSKFRQEMLNTLSTLKFRGSHLAFH